MRILVSTSKLLFGSRKRAEIVFFVEINKLVSFYLVARC